jgi:hypothetical protein
LLAACADNQRAKDVFVVHAASDLPKYVGVAAQDLAGDLQKITPRTVAVSTDPSPGGCVPGQVHVDVRGIDASLAKQEYTVVEQRCAHDGHLVIVRGGSLLSAQWAVYDVAQDLGIRYFHAEETLYPKALVWPDAPIARDEKPAFQDRSIHVHTAHPIEMSAPLNDIGIDMHGYMQRWVDWNIKLRATGVDGWDFKYVGTYPWDRGFTRGTGLNLLESQQGAIPTINPDDPRPEEVQVEAAIDNVMKPDPNPNVPPATSFEFLFNPSEFTVADDYQTVHRMQYIPTYIAEHYPGVPVWTINHGTHEDPTPHFGVRFFDLPEFGPPNLGVSVHPLMFYDLDRAAPVYGNTDFNFQRDFITAQAKIRQITYYPEGSWWLTFDEPVPLYLAPVTIDARQHDIDFLAPMLAPVDTGATHGVVSHELFSSGEEWGYWLIDYCFNRMSFDLNITGDACLKEFTDTLEHAGDIFTILKAVQARQIVDMRDPDKLRFLVGSDDATEAAYGAGVIFHPIPPAPSAVLAYTDAQVTDLQAKLDALRAMAGDYHGWANQLTGFLADEDERQAPWVREIRDGLAIFALRCDHAASVYSTAIALRAAIAAKDPTMIADAKKGVDATKAITESARAVVMAREQDYRYPPSLTTDGDEAGTPGAIPNQTIYPYRYLSRTHRLFYWTRPDDQLDAMFGGGLQVVQVNQRILKLTEPLDVALLASGVTSLSVDYGDGTTATALAPHSYAADGFYDWSLNAVAQTGVIMHDDVAAAVDRRFVFPKGSFHVIAPSGGGAIEGLLPGFAVGIGTDATGDFEAIGRLDDASNIEAEGSVSRRDRTGLTSAAADLQVSLSMVGDVTVHGAVLTVTTPATLDVTGSLDTQQIVDLLVSVGGFDQAGAKTLIAGLLGYTPDTLPAMIDFEISSDGFEDLN